MISDVLWQRPSREEFDVWGTELGNGPTWSFDALEPYYRKAENWTGPPIKTLPGGRADPALGKVFGKNGPMQISYNNYYPDLIEESVAAANALGARTSSNPVSSNSSSLLPPLPSPPHRPGGRIRCFGLRLSQMTRRKLATPLVSSLRPERSIPDRELDPHRSLDILNRMRTGRTSSCSLVPKLPKCCSRLDHRTRRRHESPRRSSLCRAGKSTR
jgi:hypothetical protein